MDEKPAGGASQALWRGHGYSLGLVVDAWCRARAHSQLRVGVVGIRVEPDAQGSRELDRELEVR